MDYLQPERKYAIERLDDAGGIRLVIPAEFVAEIEAMPYWRLFSIEPTFCFAIILPTYNADAVIAWLDTWLDEKTNDIPLSDIWRLDE